MQAGKRVFGLTLGLLSLIGAADAVHASDLNITPRIVGGESVSINLAPATVALINNRVMETSGSYFQSQFCGGTVIDSRWVLTAAHCLVQDGVTKFAGDIGVLMGSTDLSEVVNPSVGVTRVIVHAGFDEETMINDIALLQLEFDSLVQPVALDNQAIRLNDLALITGWGALNPGDQGQQQIFPTGLRGAYVRMVPAAECANRFSDYAGLIEETHLCAGNPDGRIDTCQGDSGGPLYRYDTADPSDLKLAGVTSWGYGCGDAETPGVYTRVAAYDSWIRAATGPSDDAPVPDQGFLVGVSESETDDDVDGEIVAVAVAGALVGAAAFAGAGSGGYMIPLLALVLWYRRRARGLVAGMNSCSADFTGRNQDPVDGFPGNAGSLKRRFMRSLGFLGLAAMGQPVYACGQAGQGISLADLMLGQDREPVLQAAAGTWGSQPECTLERTGYGQSRRAYFLETCSFSNVSGVSLCGSSPVRADYRLFENRLVQISFEYDQRDSSGHYPGNYADNYSDCIREQSALLEQQQPVSISVTIDSDFRTTISNADVAGRIHVLNVNPY